MISLPKTTPPQAQESLPTNRCPFDPDRRYEELRTDKPVARVSTPAGFDVWLVTRYEDARAVLADAGTFSSVDASSSHLMGDKDNLGAPPPPGVMLRHDGDSHSRLRLRLAREFMVKRVAKLEPFIRQLVSEHIDRLAERTGPVDLYRAFGLPVPALVISEILGVAEEDRDEFERATASQVNLSLSLEERQAAAIESAGFFVRLVQSKIENPGDDLISRLILEPAERPLNAAELQGIALLLLAAGHDTTANMITLGTYALLKHPEQAAKLQDAAFQETGVDELIRYLTIVHNGVLGKPPATPLLADKASGPASTSPSRSSQPTATATSSGTQTTSTWTGSPPTSDSGTARTNAWGSTLRGWNFVSRCPNYSGACAD